MPKTVKVTQKGQVTIPRNIRSFLKSDVVEFVVIDGNVMVKPVESVAGSLKSYAKKYTPLKDVREEVWEEVVHDRVGKKTS